ncbi:hypothetical protein CVT24_013398 [Panaeolus cyanescens]|uniref:Extracellular membrane protein CFEM domain-containing protein n=1 Tax=Panaeolus cyanescens TaxID=181874 RepID=A0A409YMS8_9AGAR|nr:hypothetical protein CVT24_013398 [Panaeolus cyanescens]
MRSFFFGALVIFFVSFEALAFERTSLTRAAFQRQTTDVCDTPCNTFDDTVQACDTKACLCTASNADTLQQCISCYMTYAPSDATTAAAQNLVDTFENACEGYALPPVTVPSPSSPTGDSPNSPIASSRGTSFPVTSARPVNNPDPTPAPAPAQQTNTANFPAASAANPHLGPAFGGDLSLSSFMRSDLVAFCVFFVMLVVATSANPDLAVALRGHTALFARQTNPGTCSTACSDSRTVINDCVTRKADAACLCTLPNAHLLQQCIDCSLLAAGDDATVQTAQKIATSFNTLCVSSASSVPPLTVPGTSPSGSISASGSAGVSVTAPGNTVSASAPAPPPTTIQQITIGPSSSTPDSTPPPTVPGTQTTPPVGGAASKSTLVPTLELCSLVTLVVALFSM